NGRRRLAVQLGRQAPPVDEFQRKIRLAAGMLAHLEDLHDVGMLQAGDCLRLRAKASGNPSNCAEADTAASANVVADDRAATANALAEIPLTQRLGGAAQGAFPGQP